MAVMDRNLKAFNYSCGCDNKYWSLYSLIRDGKMRMVLLQDQRVTRKKTNVIHAELNTTISYIETIQ